MVSNLLFTCKDSGKFRHLFTAIFKTDSKTYSTTIENDFVGDSNMYMYVSGLQISLLSEPECFNKESIVLFFIFYTF